MAKHTANRTRNMYPPVYAKVVETMLLDAMMFNNNNNATTYTVYEEKKSAGKAFEFRSNSSVLSLAFLASTLFKSF